MILLPVKNLANAKQRLAAVLDQQTRTELAKAMLFDVLEVLGAWAGRPEVALVTNDPFALDLAAQFDFRRLRIRPIVARPMLSRWRPESANRAAPPAPW